MPAKLDFEFEESFSNRYHSIQQVLDAAVYTTVDVKVKIMLKQEEKQPVFTHGTTKYKVDATVGDKTNIIKTYIMGRLHWKSRYRKIISHSKL